MALIYEKCVRLIKSFNLVISYGRDGTIMILDADKLDAKSTAAGIADGKILPEDIS
ncbi:hypothetical protein [Nostoc sp.]|uniref:hypothetical protein n=1 Tax=Nostoc sp. TaxID=1180 RepID=UPI002FF7F5E1